MNISRNDILFFIALLCAIWFAWGGMVWTYCAALFIAYPFGLLSLILWRIIRHENKKRTKWIPIILTTGLFLSLVVLAGLLIYN